MYNAAKTRKLKNYTCGCERYTTCNLLHQFKSKASIIKINITINIYVYIYIYF